MHAVVCAQLTSTVTFTARVASFTRTSPLSRSVITHFYVGQDSEENMARHNNDPRFKTPIHFQANLITSLEAKPGELIKLP
jgi:hypothetical protein